MKRLLATAVAAVLSVPLLATPPAAAAPDVSPNLVSHGTFSPAFELADTGWECEPGTEHEYPRPGAEFVHMLPLKDPYVPPTVVAKPALPQPTASVPATPGATSPTPATVPTTRPGAELVQQAAAGAPPAAAGPPAAGSTPASALAAVDSAVRSNPESAMTRLPYNRMPVRAEEARLVGKPSNIRRAECAQVVPVRTNSTYTLSARVSGGWVFLGSDYGTAFTRPTPQDVTLTHTFVTGPTTDRVRIYLHGWYDGGTYEADDVVLTGPPSDSRVPEAPRRVHIDERTSSSAFISWATSPGATSYEVLHNGVPVGTTTDPWTVVSGMTPGQQHTLTVQARNPAGASQPSPSVRMLARLADRPPTAPSVISSNGPNTLMLLRMGASGPTDGYLVYVDGVVVGWSYYWQFRLPMTPGTHTIEVVAFNSAGGSAPGTLTVTVPAR
jgi:hypothetical protein